MSLRGDPDVRALDQPRGFPRSDSLGKGIREFKGSIREIEGDLKVPDERPRVSRASDPQEE